MPDVIIDSIGGWCPCQGEGRVDGRIWYFRSRHCHWTLEVWAPGVEFKEGGGLPDADAEFIWSGDDSFDGRVDEGDAEKLVRQMLGAPVDSWPRADAECSGFWVNRPVVLP